MLFPALTAGIKEAPAPVAFIAPVAAKGKPSKLPELGLFK
jgi:hypothetical protein